MAANIRHSFLHFGQRSSVPGHNITRQGRRATERYPLSRATLRMQSLARYLPPGQPLLDLHGPEDDGAQRDGDGEVRYGQRLGLQKALKEGSVDREKLQHEGQGDRPEERL